MTTSRKLVRKALGSAMEGDLVGEGLPAVGFASYHKTDFGGASPVITLSTAGSGLPPMTTMGSSQEYFYEINTLIIRPNQTEVDAGYTEKDVEDILDDMYDAIKTWISQNRKDSQNNEWQHISIIARSNIIPIVDDGGRGYFMENIPIKVEVF